MSPRLEHVEATKDEAVKLGAEIELKRRTKHICGIIKLNGKQRKIFLSISTKSGSVCNVVREDVRKKVREMQNV